MKEIILKRLKSNWMLQTSIHVMVMQGRLESILRANKDSGLKVKEGDIQMAGHRTAAREGVSLGSGGRWNFCGKRGG